MIHAAAISKEKLATLNEIFRNKALNWYQDVVVQGIIPYIYEGYRTNNRQSELYAQGRTAPGRVVTNAMAGQSFHNYGFAFDWVPLKSVDKAAAMYEADWDNNHVYAIGAAIGVKHGMRALSWETPHLEDASFANWRDLKAKYGN